MSRSPKFSAQISRKFAVFGGGFLGGWKGSDYGSFPVRLNLGDIPVSGGAKMHTLETALVVSVDTFVLNVVRVIAGSKIVESVIRAIGIPMINIFRSKIVHHLYDDARNGVRLSGDLNFYDRSVVAPTVVRRSRGFAGLTGVYAGPSMVRRVMVPRTGSPRKDSGFRVIREAFLKVKLGRQYVAASHVVPLVQVPRLGPQTRANVLRPVFCRHFAMSLSINTALVGGCFAGI